MLRNTGIISLVGATVFGLAPIPAQADEAVVQTSTQEAVISGDNNRVTQVTNQINISHPGRGKLHKGNRAVVQDAYQGASVSGRGNNVFQRSRQRNSSRRFGRSDHPGLHKGHHKHRDRDDD